MQRILITGGAGFIGHYASAEFVSRDCRVTVFDSFQTFDDPLETGYGEILRGRADQRASSVEIRRGDIRDRGQIAAALRAVEPSVVVHLAAMPLATASNRYVDEAIGINLDGTIGLLQAVRECPSVRRVVFVSSSFVYGHFRSDPAGEEHVTDPIDVYGATKLAGEAMVKGFGRRYGVEHVIVRLSAVYGPLDANRRVAQLYIENALAGRPLLLHNGGTSRVDFTYCRDAATGVVLAALEPGAANEVFNITRGEGRSLAELADIIRAHVPDLKTEVGPSDATRPERGALSVEKARRLIGYAPKWSLEDGVADYLTYIRSQARAPRLVA